MSDPLTIKPRGSGASGPGCVPVAPRSHLALLRVKQLVSAPGTTLRDPSVLSRNPRQPHSSSRFEMVGQYWPISLASYGVTWRFLAALSSSDGASSDRSEEA